MLRALKVASLTATASGALLVAMGLDRLIIAGGVLVAVTVLTFSGKVDVTTFVAIVGPLVGYVVGAGHEASKSSPRSAEG